MKFLITKLIIAVLIAGSAFANEKDLQKQKNRFEELFIWKVSDRLNLKVSEENRFREEFNKLSERRSHYQSKLDELIEKLQKNTSNVKTTETLIEEYTGALQKLGEVQVDEVKILGKIFTQKQLVEYLILKKDFAQKIKELALTVGNSKVEASPEPKVINQPEKE